MTTYSNLIINGIDIGNQNAYDYTVKQSINSNNSSSSFTATLDNFQGINKATFSIGDNVVVYGGSIAPPATPVAVVHSSPPTGSTVEGNARGFQITMNQAGTINQVIINGSCTATLCYVCDNVGNILGSASFVGSLANINVPVSPLNNYRVVAGNGLPTGGNYSGLVFGSAVFPISGTLFNWTAAINASTIQSSNPENIANIVVTPISNNSLLFNGILEDIEYQGDDTMSERVLLSGRDYTARLQDVTIQPTNYFNTEVGSIVRNIMATYVPDVSYSGVQSTSTIISGISFNQASVDNAIQQLATLAGNYIYYIGTDKDLKFIPQTGSASGYTFDSGNTIKSNIKGQRDTVYNQIWVYGDRYLDGYNEKFTAGSPLGGSVFNLQFIPFNVNITVSGGIVQPGQVLGQINTLTSGAAFVVDQNNKLIIFTSGTTLNNNIPTSGNQVSISYYRQLPIVKVGNDFDSQAKYGIRNKVIIDTSIKTPSTAQALVEQYIAQYAAPSAEINLTLRGVTTIIPGQSAIVNLPFEGVTGFPTNIIEASYDFNKENNLKDEVLTVRLNSKISDITDTLKNIILDLKKAQASTINTAGTITKLLYTTGSFSIGASGCVVYTRTIGSSFILSHPINGLLGSIAGLQPILGDQRGSKVIVWSGCYDVMSGAQSTTQGRFHILS